MNATTNSTDVMYHSNHALGAAAAVSAAFLTSLGVVLQRKSWRARIEGAVPPTYEMWWKAGVACFVSASVIDAGALYVTTQMVVTSLSATSLIFNAALSTWISDGVPCGESRIQVTVASLLACIGIGIFSFPIRASPAGKTVVFGSYTTLLWCVASGLFYVAMVLKLRESENVIRTFGIESIDYANAWKRHRTQYAVLIGITGAASTVIESAFEKHLVSAAFTPPSVQSGPVVFALILSGVATLVLSCVQLYWLNQALARFSDAFLVPMSIVWTTLWGATFSLINMMELTSALYLAFFIMLCELCSWLYERHDENGPWMRHVADPASPHAAERLELVESGRTGDSDSPVDSVESTDPGDEADERKRLSTAVTR